MPAMQLWLACLHNNSLVVGETILNINIHLNSSSWFYGVLLAVATIHQLMGWMASRLTDWLSCDCLVSWLTGQLLAGYWEPLEVNGKPFGRILYPIVVVSVPLILCRDLCCSLMDLSHRIWSSFSRSRMACSCCSATTVSLCFCV